MKDQTDQITILKNKLASCEDRVIAYLLDIVNNLAQTEEEVNLCYRIQTELDKNNKMDYLDVVLKETEDIKYQNGILKPIRQAADEYKEAYLNYISAKQGDSDPEENESKIDQLNRTSLLEISKRERLFSMLDECKIKEEFAEAEKWTKNSH